MKRKSHNGCLITFEGGEGAGKSTLMERLYEDLSSRGLDVIKTKAPGGTDIGLALRKIVLGNAYAHLSKRAELFLFLADRAQHVDELINPALNEGKIVLVDRFTDSTLAYQGAAREFGDWNIGDFCNFATNNLTPDLTLFLDLDPEVGLVRAKKENAPDRIEKERMSFHHSVREAFTALANAEPNRFVKLDGSLSKSEVFDRAKAAIDERL